MLLSIGWNDKMMKCGNFGKDTNAVMAYFKVLSVQVSGRTHKIYITSVSTFYGPNKI
jgi:hypothetical protein